MTQPMQFKAVMFDLDGTLADTLADIAAAGNYVLAQFNRPRVETREFRYLAGQGVRWLVQRALDTHDEATIERGVMLFREHYHEHGHAQTRPYDGIESLLDALTKRAMPLAVLSNKPDVFTQQVVTDKFSRWHFDAVAGQKPGIPLKPDPAAALLIAGELGIPPSHWVYIGDTRIDMLTARAAGFHAVGVTWGFRDEAELRENGADAIIHHPMDLMNLL